ncbi:MAG: GC-type dockerin domain-anchored protein [Planctomycetota bacterium]
MAESRYAIFTTIASLLVCAGASASITHPSGDSAVFSHPPTAVMGQWGSNASLVAVGPNHAITTRHQGGGVGGTVTFDGVPFVVAEQTVHPTADLRVVRLTKPDGSDADLAEWVNVGTSTGETGRVAVVTGYGVGRGADVLDGTGQLIGYAWASTRSLGVGQNTIEGAAPDQSAIGFTSDWLFADFDSVSDGVPGEATVADGDSGGGWYLFDGGEWSVVAINIAVENAFQAIFNPPELMVALRVSSYSTFINDLLPVVNLACNEADVTSSGATLQGQPGFGEPDGVIDLDDLGYYLSFWLAGDAAIADVTTTGATLTGQAGFGVPDGFVDLDDLGYYLGVWLGGCP